MSEKSRRRHFEKLNRDTYLLQLRRKWSELYSRQEQKKQVLKSKVDDMGTLINKDDPMTKEKGGSGDVQPKA